MSSQTPFTLSIFVADGDPDGLQIVERTNWNGKAVVFPKAIYADVRKRDEFSQTAIYLLLGRDEANDEDMVYVGEADIVRERFNDHVSKKDFWTRAVFFVAGPGHLNKAHVKYLEHRLCDLGNKAKRARMENGNAPSEPNLSESDKAAMDVFLSHMLGILPVLGVDAFEQSSVKETSPTNPLLYAETGKAKGTGKDTAQGFIIIEGSLAAVEEVPSLSKHFPRTCKLRQKLLDNGVLVPEGEHYRFTQDYTFSSPSLAGEVLLGRPSNGRVDWKAQDGRTLKEIQEAQAAD
jgi:hypothetical protein